MASREVGGLTRVIDKVPLPTAARMTKFGLIGGLTFGLMQDGLRLLQGHNLAYVDLVKQKLGFGSTEGPSSGAEV